MKKSKKNILIILCVILALIIIAVSSFFILRYVGKNRIHKEDKNIKTNAATVVDEDTVEYGGKKYTLNKNIVSILFMGVDKKHIDDNFGYGKNGQADCIFVAAVDTATKSIKIIPISRETMVDVNTYSESGIYSGVKNEQLCLAFAYGNSAESSAKNVLTSVQRLLYGINISSYVAMETKGISEFSTLIGGVPVTVKEEISIKGKPLTIGDKLTLSGDKAVEYIWRRGDDLEANNRRMERQKQFLNSMVNVVSNKLSRDFTLLPDYYNTMKPYISTNLGLPEITYIASECLSKDLGDKLIYKTVSGTMTKGKYAEFHPDETSLITTVLDVFYTEVQ